ncbi:vacuolar protein sorting 25 [Heterostelium album PN500]|uniref:Vacuolar protein-sorting-associated protein 25 n=1 Tax=Heterostelium pallidum (strain ATCC 26659 / Pp 5 / PN500) TaxID=670386 RepID=D3BKE7_HETP5|nr:vacuolar protein sorting 25 [Heterostelium album PN500]EFA78377.1 vacuolar protein sorting 25 [Heterostelium album PN500]|eukprot:XP_020430502.1 vacuolar protein sorting 25 [Heterostelium album PN500]
MSEHSSPSVKSPPITSAFPFPSYYNREPFFTLQPILNTQKKQLQMWQELILSYTRYHKIYELDINEYIKRGSELFNNEKIKRKLSQETIVAIFNEIVDSGYGEWLDKDKSRALVWWRKPDEWASIIYQWVVDSGQTDSILTVWEIQKGDDTKNLEFHEINTNILMKALKSLEKQGKAQIFSGSENNLGVKFFSTH